MTTPKNSRKPTKISGVNIASIQQYLSNVPRRHLYIFAAAIAVVITVVLIVVNRPHSSTSSGISEQIVQSNSVADTPFTFNIDDESIPKLAVWDGTQHGLVATIDDNLAVIDIKERKLVGRTELPAQQGRTPGGDSGRSYEILEAHNAGYEPSRYVFSQNFRYVPVQFRYITSDSVGFYDQPAGVYDLKEQKATQLPIQPEIYNDTKDKKLYFDPFKPDTLIYEKYTSNSSGSLDGSHRRYEAYDFINKTTSDATKTTWQFVVSQLSREPRIASTGFLNKTGDGYVQPEYGSVELRDNGTAIESYPFVPIKMISDSALLVIHKTQGIGVIDISNILEKRTQKDNENSYNYKEGRLHYNLDEFHSLVPSFKNGYSDEMTSRTNVIVSKDNKTLYWVDYDGSDTTVKSLDISKYHTPMAAPVFPDEARTVAKASGLAKIGLLDWK